MPLLFKPKLLQQHLLPAVLKPCKLANGTEHSTVLLQQHLSLAVCAEGCETAEERSDDEAHTLQVPERREG